MESSWRFHGNIVKEDPNHVREFMDRANDFINAKDSLPTLTASRKSKLEYAEGQSKGTNGRKNYEKEPKTMKGQTPRVEGKN